MAGLVPAPRDKPRKRGWGYCESLERWGGRSLRGWERAEIVGAVPDSSGYARLAVIRTDPGADDAKLTTSPVMQWRIVPRAQAG